MRINNIKKDYGKSVKILKFNHSIDIEPPRCKVHQNISCMICWPRKKDPFPSASSLQRTKTVISDYILCNDFDLFVTFTFDPKKVDSKNEQLAKKVFSTWLANTRRSCPNFSYIVVAEFHKSGAIHFHGVFSGYDLPLVDSHKRKNGLAIYNISKWRYGFSTATKIENIEKTSNYIKKYITKEMIIVGNKRRYWASRNLKKPIKTYNIDMSEVRKNPIAITGRFRSEYYQTFNMVKMPQILAIQKKFIKSRASRNSPEDSWEH